MLFLSTNFLYAQLKPISDKGIFQSKFKEKIESNDAYFPTVILNDLYVNLFGTNILIEGGLEGLKPSSLTKEDYPNGIPGNIVDVVESVESMPFEVKTKFLIQKKSEEWYSIYKLLPIIGEEGVSYSEVLLDIIDKKQFNLQRYTGEYEIKKDLITFGKHIANYEYYEDKNLERVWHGSFSLKMKDLGSGYGVALELNIAGKFKHDYRDGDWTFKGTMDGKPIDVKVTYLLGKIIYLEYYTGLNNKGSQKIFQLSYEKNGILSYVEFFGDTHYMDSNGCLNDKFTEVNGQIEEIYEYENGIEKLYLKRNKSTGAVIEKRSLDESQVNFYKKIIDLNNKNLPERLDYNYKPKKFVTSLFDLNDDTNIESFLKVLLPYDIRGDYSSTNPQVGYYYTFEYQQTRADIAAIENARLEEERLKNERLKNEEIQKILTFNSRQEESYKRETKDYYDLILWIDEESSKKIKASGVDFIYLYVGGVLEKIHNVDNFTNQQPINYSEKTIYCRKEEIINYERNIYGGLDEVKDSDKILSIQFKDKNNNNISPDFRLSKNSGHFKNGYVFVYKYDIKDNTLLKISERFTDYEKERLVLEAQKIKEKERLEKEKLEKEKLEKERLEKEKLEKERLEREKREKEKLEKERLEREKREKEKRDYITWNTTKAESEKYIQETMAGTFTIWYDINVFEKLKSNNVYMLNIYVNGFLIRKQIIENYATEVPQCGDQKYINHRFMSNLVQNKNMKIEIKDQNQKLLTTFNLTTVPLKCVLHELKF